MSDADVFGEFYTRNYKLVYRVCYTYMQNRFDAEDCTEDVFVKVLTGKHTFRDADHEAAWLTVVAMNLFRDKLKARRRHAEVSLDDVGDIADEDPGIDETLREVMRLPLKYKDVVYMYYYMGYPTDRIAAELHKPASTVRNHLREAREMLRVRLAGANA